MGLYIGQTDIESEWGTANVVQWSNLDGSTDSADATRVTAAINFAEGYVEGRFRGSRYQVPLSFGDDRSEAVVKRIMATLAGEWLASHRAAVVGEMDEAAMEDLNQLRARKQWAERTLSDILAGILVVDMTLAEDDTEAPFLVN